MSAERQGVTPTYSESNLCLVSALFQSVPDDVDPDSRKERNQGCETPIFTGLRDRWLDLGRFAPQDADGKRVRTEPTEAGRGDDQPERTP